MGVTQGLRESRKKCLPAAGVQGVFAAGGLLSPRTIER
jgi:hypothetical protein